MIDENVKYYPVMAGLSSSFTFWASFVVMIMFIFTGYGYIYRQLGEGRGNIDIPSLLNFMKNVTGIG